MTQSLTLPIRFAPQLQTQWSSSLLEQVCVPLTEAKQGDLVALELSFVRFSGHVDLLPITGVFLLDDEDKLSFRRRNPQDLTDETLARIAAPIIRLQSYNPYTGIFNIIAETLKVPQAQRLEVIMLPDCAFAAQEAYIETVCSGLHNEKITQATVDESLLALYGRFPSTSHELVEAHHDLLRLLRICNSNTPMPHPEDFNRDLPLVLPDVTEIFSV